MSVKRERPAADSGNGTAMIFGGALLLMCLIWFFGIALRVSLAEDNDIVARAGISRVLKGGFPDFRDTFLLIAVACGAYLACLWALRKGFKYSFPAVIAGTVLAGCSMLPAMPLTSPDAVHLAADVRTFWIHHKWPAEFSGAPGRIDDPVANEVRVFRNAPSGYGPLAYALGGAPIPFVGDGFKANIVGQKIMGLIFLTATAAAAGMVAKRMGQNPALIAGIVGLNPMMTWQFPGDGHNDSMMAFFGLIALGLVMERTWPKRGAGVLAWLASALCKYAFILASPVVAAWWWPKWRYALAGITVAGFGGLLFLYAQGSGPVRNGTLGPAGAVVQTTPWRWVELWLDTGPRGHDYIILGGYIGYLEAIAGVMVLHPLKTREDLVRGVGLVMSVFLFISPAYHPWYIVWMLPFAALSNARYLIAGAVAFSLLAFLPVLALNWNITLARTWNLQNAVEWFTAVMWFGTLAATYVGWRGGSFARFGGRRAKQASGPKFAPRQRRKASGRA